MHSYDFSKHLQIFRNSKDDYLADKLINLFHLPNYVHVITKINMKLYVIITDKRISDLFYFHEKLF